MDLQPETFLRQLFDRAVDFAQAKRVLPKYLSSLPPVKGKTLVLGAGKAVAAMASVLEDVYEVTHNELLQGLVVVPYGHGVLCRSIEVIEAAHPVPDEAGVQAAARILNLATQLGEHDRLIFLVSGGGSSLLSLPAAGISLADKQAVNHALLKSGATIHEMNGVRKHLSAIKGGRLALAAQPAEVLTFAISDVPGDDPSVIASGPTVADASTRQEALEVLLRYEIPLPVAVSAWLKGGASETPAANHPALVNSYFHLVASPMLSCNAAISHAKSLGVDVLFLGDDLQGEARDLASQHAELVCNLMDSMALEAVQNPCVLISGGETTVTLRGQGRGGRNTEYLLGLMAALSSRPECCSRVYALAADTDGIDGSEDNAGAIFGPKSYGAAQRLPNSLMDYLNNNDGYSFFESLGSLVCTGPTYTNVNDFRAILILP